MNTSLQFMWSGGNTRRYHTMRTVMEDTVGHHSYNVACIIMHLRPDCRAVLLRAALKHDMAEHMVGDMPAPTKRAMPDYVNDAGQSRTFREVFGEYEESRALEYGVALEEGQLTEGERWVLKLADAMDGMRFCIQERQLGNSTGMLVECYGNFVAYVSMLLYGTDVPPLPQTQAAARRAMFAEPQDIALFHYLREQWQYARRA